MEDRAYSPKDIEKISDETLAVYHILQLAGQGRPHEVVAQFMASWLMSSDLDDDEIIGWGKEWKRVYDRALTLCLNPEDIWEGLLPGSPWSKGFNLETIDADEWTKLHDSQRTLEQVREAFAKNYVANDDLLDYGARLEAIGKILHPSKLWEPPQAHEPNGIDEYKYAVSIIIDPRVRHDNPTDRMSDVVVISETSPLNMANYVWEVIDQIDKKGKWPAEELSAWITHAESDTHFVMTFDQAAGLKALEEASQKLETQDFDDTFQHEYETMLIVGREYIAGKDGQKLRHGVFLQ